MSQTKEIKTIVVLLEFEDGSVRQVLTTKEQKQLALGLLINGKGVLQCSDAIEPFEFKFL